MVSIAFVALSLVAIVLLLLSLVFLTADAINLKNVMFRNRNAEKERPKDSTTSIRKDEPSIRSSDTSTIEEEHPRTRILDTNYKDEEITTTTNNNNNHYGLDVSYPAQQNHVSDPKRQLFYDSILQSCQSLYSLKTNCEDSERNRIFRNTVQPPLMKNFSLIGFQRDQLPQYWIDELTEFWDEHYYSSSFTPEEEHWHPSTLDTTYTNHWQSPTYMLHFDQQPYSYLRQALIDIVQQKLYDWIATFPQDDEEEEEDDNIELVLTSFYGIRIYKEHSIVAPHVDRLPFVFTAIILVAQENNDTTMDDWPLELYGHDGKAYNITLQTPGDMVLYEGHSIIHGHPFPFPGKHSAHIVVHFEPKGYTQQLYNSLLLVHTNHQKDDIEETSTLQNYYDSTLKKQQQQQQQQHMISKQHPDHSLPFYLHRGGIEELLWNPGRTTSKRKIKISVDTSTTSVSPLSIHQISARGDLDALYALVSINPDVIHEKDKNGWQPIHEAARGGHTEMIQYLLDHGVDINARTNGGIGRTPLYWAKKKHGKAHESVKLLESRGALEVDPEL